MYTPTVRPFFDIDSVFLIQIFCGTKNTGQNGQGMKNIPILADPFMIHKWEKNPD